MDQILAYLAGVLGVSPTTFLLILGVFVSVCNLVGKLIPDDATGYLAVVRKIAKVGGLYVSTRITSDVTVNDAARAVAGATAITTKDAAGRFQSTTLRSPWVVAVLAGAFALFLSGCTIAQAKVATLATQAVCENIPLAQAALDSAAQTKRVADVERILNHIQAVCPEILTAIDMGPLIKLGVTVK
jgi:hypothetical protein